MIIPIPERLAQLRVARGIPQRRVAEAAGVALGSITRWDTGRGGPTVGNAATYAALVERRLVVTRDGHLVGDLLDTLPDLQGMRQAARLSQAALADRMEISATSVGALERHAGPTSHLGSVQRYLEALRYEVVLEPVELAVAG
ncbi:helix-turn-helix transcriptional regulator [Streptosporangium sp. NBC_01755]|uniref:helix-turn-helix transcriptional regulator n=1 Tax=Streptosporangium sp. NBC_01755 TaxID=2975949 RepID=UPI002DD8D06C|nr:helix-turn-helix transcriptional regulator [Streptosporangium sp. NBC_01755]WSD01499.1 helix-turn-helix transcriptional regulator [Streptosporangium sp. NBC_01755]WSD03785.1 helix-turn-helix transcriptional regulator [Streptosporangium sp. NBC_01755]